MGSIQSYLTSPPAILLVAAIGAASYVTSQRGQPQLLQQPQSDPSSSRTIDSASKQSTNISASTITPTASSGSKKNKKKKAGATSDAPSASGVQPNVVSLPPAIPGGFEPTTPTPETPTESATKSKKKKKAKKAGKVKSPATIKVTLDEAEDRPPVLCISRNKHWRYISSYHVRNMLLARVS